MFDNSMYPLMFLSFIFPGLVAFPSDVVSAIHRSFQRITMLSVGIALCDRSKRNDYEDVYREKIQTSTREWF